MSGMLAKLENARETLPESIGSAARVIVDNPKEFAVVAAGSFVLTRIACNAVQPRNPFEAGAVFLVSQLACVYLFGKAVDKGVLNFRLRDENGKLPEAADAASKV